MSLPNRNAVAGLMMGGLCALAVGLIGPGTIMAAFADEMNAPLDASNLVKFEDKTYSVDYEDSVKTEPTSHTRIRKIEYGRTSFVDISTTESGTYSSEGLYSPHFRYPGIHVKRVANQDASIFTYWGGTGWIGLPIAAGNSFVSVRTKSSRLFMSGGSTCVLTKTYGTCN
jgi:hypothetical protein